MKGETAMDVMKFCTCENHSCGCHPSRHSDGCDRCIALNLHDNCIPRCFFHKIGCKTEEVTHWTMEEFAQKVLEKQRQNAR